MRISGFVASGQIKWNRRERVWAEGEKWVAEGVRNRPRGKKEEKGERKKNTGLLACVWASEGGEAEPKRRKRKEGKEEEESGLGRVDLFSLGRGLG